MAGKTRRTYKGAAVSALLDTSGVTSSTQTAISLTTSPSTWPSGKFFVVVAPGTAQEEKMCVTVSGSTLTVVNPNNALTTASASGRGIDDTTARSTITGGAVIYPVYTAIDANEANELTSTYSAEGHIVYQGNTTFSGLSIGTAGQVLKVNSGATAPEWGTISAGGIADGAITEAKLGSGSVTSDKISNGAIMDTDINASAAIALSKLATGALPTAITIASANIVDGTITKADLATALQNLLVPVGTISAYAGATAPSGWLLCDGTTSTSGYTGLAALVGATTPDLKGKFLMGVTASGIGSTLLGSGGSATIATTNLPAHSHGVGTLSTSSSGNHDHTGTTSSIGDHTHPSTATGYENGSWDWKPTNSGTTISNWGYDVTTGAAGGHSHTFTTASGGSHTHTLSGSTADAGGAQAYYQPFVAVSYIIKHD